MKNSMEAYAYADKFGFKYKRARIGVSIYRSSDNLETLEISHDWAALYDNQPKNMKKRDRLRKFWKYETTTNNGATP